MKKPAQDWRKLATDMAKQAEEQPERFPLMIEQLANHDPQVSVPAIWALEQAGPIAIPYLLEGLKHPHTKVRRNCVDIIDHGGFGSDARCVEGLLHLLDDWVAHIRRAVWHTLFCERCPDDNKCEVRFEDDLDYIGMIIDIGLKDPNLKLRRQLVGELIQHREDLRVRATLEQILVTEDDAELLNLARQGLKTTQPT